MAQEEYSNERDLTYSAWHRRNSMQRYIDRRDAEGMSMIDIDAVEYDQKTREPLILIETARDNGQGWKAATVTRNLAKRAGIPAYVLLYTPSEIPNPSNEKWPDIKSFRVKCIWPEADTEWRFYSAREWVEELNRIRQEQLDKMLIPAL